ncbi:hypothetical protein [Kibdelosporangium philippinense]|uniref:hypothetical protein n=1 Tax=Kibdelosporangium philippinense TaxID=211113 RepID=UPI003615B810
MHRAKLRKGRRAIIFVAAALPATLTTTTTEAHPSHEVHPGSAVRARVRVSTGSVMVC